MICTTCNIQFPEHIKVCPRCNQNTINDRRKQIRRQDKDGIPFEERRERSDRRKAFIKRFGEVFWKGDCQQS